ncbi:MAG: hypothetical protein Q3M24_01665 [Candidatus Electrothrix aestuarii]|uniref:Uncharacterized protein n=1 Tax=Candidatus Electrothrix aestuarii TaxID=3062594 RepID=A0AAU8LXB2_9BACT|nr:hypothetical protein [Candidatus Electrothrix aestuarii]WPD22447.1 MAG: hypothetical protein SD837_19935 [Candidatus Electrothrix sp. GW3-3]
MAEISVQIHSLFDLTDSREIRSTEKFTFSVTTINSSEADAVALENVRYHVRVEDPSLAKLIVPPTNPDNNGTGYKGVDAASGELVELAPNAEVAEMVLFPRAVTKPVDMGDASPVIIEGAGALGIGDSDVLSLKGIALATGSTQLTCQVSGEPDVEIPLATKTLDII